MPLALENEIMIAIVTFSSEVKLISELLGLMLGTDVASHILVRGPNCSGAYTGKAKPDEGKQKHMASAAEEFKATKGVDITRNSTLLIDDDERNIRFALSNNVRAVHFKVNDIDSTVDTLLNIGII